MTCPSCDREFTESVEVESDEQIPTPDVATICVHVEDGVATVYLHQKMPIHITNTGE